MSVNTMAHAAWAKRRRQKQREVRVFENMLDQSIRPTMKNLVSAA